MSTIALPQIKGAGTLTHSRMQAYKTCARKHYIAYELGIRPDTDAVPLRMGSALHAGIDSRAKGATIDAAILAGCLVYDGDLPAWCQSEEQQHNWFVERETVAAMLSGYFWFWENAQLPPELDTVEVLASEIAFNLPIRNPDTGASTPSFDKGGKIDQIVRLRDARVAVLETKSAGESLEPGSDYWKRLRIDQQISHYHVAATELDYQVLTVLYNVLRKPGIAPKQIPSIDEKGAKVVVDANGERMLKTNIKKSGEPGAGHGDPYQSVPEDKKDLGWRLVSRVESPEEFRARLLQDITERPDFYFARREIPRLDADLAEFKHELWQIQQQIREAQKTGRWFRNTAACLIFGKCPYFEPCTSGHNWTASIPSGYVRVEDLHPELAAGE